MGQTLRNIIVILAIVTVCGTIGAGLVVYVGASILEALIGVAALFAVFVSLYNNQIQFGQFSKINRQLQETHNFEHRISNRLRDMETEKRNSAFVNTAKNVAENPNITLGNTLPNSENLAGNGDEYSTNPSILSELSKPKPILGVVEDVGDIENEIPPFGGAESNYSSDIKEPTDPSDTSDNVIPLIRRSSIGDIAANINALVDSIHLKPSHLAKALEVENLELFLQPTLQIPSRDVAYFEASIRILIKDEKLDQSQFGQTALDARHMPQIDYLAMSQAFRIVRFLQRQKSNMPVFLEISPQTLRNQETMDLIIEALKANKAICEMLVYELPQSDFGRLNSTQRQNLARIRDIGYNLCLKDVNDKETVKRIIESDLFSYLKIPAPALMRIGGADILNFADEIVPDARSRKLTLIASNIENEAQIVAMIDANVFLAQGNGLVPAKPLKKELDAGNM